MTLRRASVALAVCTVSYAAIGCSPDRTTPDGTARLDKDPVTIEGCLTTGEDGRAVLTAAPDQGVSTAARAGTGDRDTHTYVLVGGENLQANVGKRVEITGRVSEDRAQVEHEGKDDATRTSATRPGEDARVRSTEEVDLQIRQLVVESMREVAPTCQLNP
jgi:hypothetical protein